MNGKSKPHRPWLTPLFIIAAWASAALPSSPALAQAPFVELTREQEDLLKKGVEATNKGEFDKALQFYTAALGFGQVNLAFMGMGRTQQKAGQCQEAAASFKMALKAPAVATPSPEKIREVIEGYRVEMAELCPGALTVRCQPPGLILTIDGESAACGEALKVAAGEHAIRGSVGEQSEERQVVAVAGEHQEITMHIATLGASPGGEGGDSGDGSGGRVAGWALVGVGGALAVTGGAMGLALDGVNGDMLALSRQEAIDPAEAEALRSDADTFEALQFVGLGLGAASVVVGAILLVSADSPEDAAEGDAVGLVPWVSQQGAGVSWGGALW